MMIELMLAAQLYASPPGDAPPPAPEEKSETLFKAMDADADNIVSEVEFVAYVGDDSPLTFSTIAGDDAEITREELRDYLQSADNQAQKRELMDTEVSPID